MTGKKKPYIYLNAFLAKEACKGMAEVEFIKTTVEVTEYDIDATHELQGKLYVKVPTEKSPKWRAFTESITGQRLDELENQSSSAVLILKASPDITIAFTFGYGRFLVETEYFINDFGIKTALNTLNHDSLRGVDLFTLEDQAVQKKSQASRESAASVFGIDISRDILRAVTGSAKAGIGFSNISGGDSVYSFGKEMEIGELPEIAKQLASHYASDAYKKDFSWVDNIRKLKEPTDIARLDSVLVDSVKVKSADIHITIPEVVKWDEIWGFSFTRCKSNIKPTIDPAIYLDNVDTATVNVDSLKRDKLFVFDVEENEFEHKIYKSIYFEHKEGTKTYILFSGIWYEIDNVFIDRIDQILATIGTSSLPFPTVYTWEETKDGETKEKIESEGDYNKRTSDSHGYHLLDKRLVKSNRTTTSIELCDLLTNDKEFIHVKHRKGGSAGLSHLFAQGHIAAEVMLGDRDFRKQARKELRKVKANLQNSISLDGFRSEDIEIVYLILGEDSSSLKKNLPFFSKVNLSKAYENLTQRGFKVSVAGVAKVPKP